MGSRGLPCRISVSVEVTHQGLGCVEDEAACGCPRSGSDGFHRLAVDDPERDVCDVRQVDHPRALQCDAVRSRRIEQARSIA